MKTFLVLFVVLTVGASFSSCAPKSTPTTTAAPEKDVTTTTASSTTKAPAKKKHQETFIEISYNNEKIVLGTVVNASQTKEKPVMEWKFEKDTFYTILMLNIHAPSRNDSKDADYAHWMVGNIPANDVEKGDTLIEYIGAFPQKDIGTQSFLFMLYEQPKQLEFDETLITRMDTESRKKYNVAGLIEKYDFGYALSYNAMKVQYDTYSDALRKELNISEEKKVEEMSDSVAPKSLEEEPEMEMRCMMVPKVKKEVEATTTMKVEDTEKVPETTEKVTKEEKAVETSTEKKIVEVKKMSEKN